MERTLRTRKRWHESVLLWSACAVVGAALMALAVVARLSHDSQYSFHGMQASSGSGPASFLMFNCSAPIEYPDGTTTVLHMNMYVYDREISGSSVPYIVWEFRRDDGWNRSRGDEQQVAGHFYPDLPELFASFEDEDARFARDIADWSRHGALVRNIDSITYDRLVEAFRKAARLAVRDPSAWEPSWARYSMVNAQGERFTRREEFDVIRVSTELGYSSLLVRAGQYRKVHERVFGAGIVVFGLGMVMLFFPWTVARRRARMGRCRKCGYELDGLREAMRARGEERVVCPECGEEAHA